MVNWSSVWLWTIAAILVQAGAVLGQCSTNITGPGAGAGYTCTTPSGSQANQVTYQSTIFQPSWSYTWSVSANGTIINGQGTAWVTVQWDASSTGPCSSWINLLVDNGQGCSYDYGLANGVPGKCVDVRLSPNAYYSGPGAQLIGYACLYDPDIPTLNNANSYSVSSCSGCSYSWSTSGGTLLSGQGTPTCDVRWMQPTVGNFPKLDVLVGSPNGCSMSYTTQMGGYPSIGTVNVTAGNPTGPISGPSTTYANGCAYTFSSSFFSSILGGWGFWEAPGGTIIHQGYGYPSGPFGWFQDTITVVWNSPGTYIVRHYTVTPGMGSCADGTAMTVNVLPGTFAPPAIVGQDTLCLGTSTQYQVQASPGTTLNWILGNGSILGGQGTNQALTAWNNLGSGQVVVVAQSGSCIARDTLPVWVEQGLPFSLGPDTISCDPVSLQVPTGWGFPSWSTGSSAQSIQIQASSTIRLEATDSLGCRSRDTIAVVVHPHPPIALGPDTLACTDSLSIGLAGTFPQMNWNTGDSTSTIRILASGAYWLSVSDSNGCSSSDSIHVVLAGVYQVDLGPDTSSCGSPIALAPPQTSASYNWSTGATTGSIFASTDGAYWLEVADSNGCLARDTVNIRIWPLPLVNLGPDTIACADSIRLVGPPGFLAYSWAVGDTTPDFWALTTGYSVLTVTDANNCSGTDSILVQLNGVNRFELGPDTFVCEFPVLLQASLPQSLYSWSTGSVSASINVNLPGVYSLTAMDSTNCVGADTILIGQWPVVVPDLGSDTIVCQPGLVVSAHINGSMAWSNGATTDSIFVALPGVYWVEVTDSHQCSGRDTIQIDFSYPNAAISPPGPISLCPGQSQVLSGLPGYSQYFWNGQLAGPSLLVSQSLLVSLVVSDAIGCRDTSATCDVHLFPSPNTTIQQLGDTLIATGSGTYQWLDCGNNFAPVSGAIASTFVPGNSGSFAVMVLDSGCADTSACFSVNILSVPSLLAPSIAIFPNPAEDWIFLSSNELVGCAIYNCLSECVWQGEVEGKVTIDASRWTAGIYIVRFYTLDRTFIAARLVKQ